jgi:NTP pyrophosphatase (non-canonical NTP hydrolase)
MVIEARYNGAVLARKYKGVNVNIETIQSYYKARGLQWPAAKDALWFFLSEVGELAEAYLVQNEKNLTGEEIDMLARFTQEGLHADEIVSRVDGWIRNNDRVRKEDIRKEVADCEMMLAVFMYSLTGSTPDEALLNKMKEKLGDKAQLLD